MVPTGDDIFDLIIICEEFALVGVIAYGVYKLIKWIWSKWKAYKNRKADKLAAKRKIEWAAEIEKAGIKLMNATADYHRKKCQTVVVKGAYAHMAECWK